MINKILDFFFPPKCAFCREILTDKLPVCRDCLKSLPFLGENTCRHCGRELEEFSYSTCASCRKEKLWFEHCFVPLSYKGSAKDSIVAFKSSHPYYAKAFAYLLADRILSSPDFVPFDAITYVPQSKRSKFLRGYNQSELIARELSKLINVPCISTLIRTNDGEKQATLDASSRKENVKKCYFKGEGHFCGTVLLTDDIYTTGATTNYCAKLLRQMGFDRVYLAVATTGDMKGR